METFAGFKRFIRKAAILPIAALLTAFFAGSAVVASASALGEAEYEPAADEPAAAARPGAPAVLSLPPIALSDFGVRLIGTAIVDRGSSVAVIQFPNGTRFVREGEEIVAGMRLVKIRRDRIDFERSGVIQDMRARSGAGPVIAGESPPIPLPVDADATQMWQTHGRLGRSMFYSHFRR